MEKRIYAKQDELTLKKIHAVLMIIAKEIKRICEKNNIHYFMLAGTQLGAVRHKGFIPWDDDMDLGMLRDDYDKFLEVCKTDLDHEHFLVQNFDTEPGFGKFYTRIILKNTSLTYDYIKNVNTTKGFFVDVFPYENTPKSKILQKKQCMIMSFALRIVKEKTGYAYKCRTLGGKIQILFKDFFTLDFVKNLYIKEMKRYNNKPTELINSANAGYGYFNEILKKKWVMNVEQMQFEDITLPGIKDYDEYLTSLYGDYMKIPDEDDRVTHEFNEIDFGPYDNILDENIIKN